MSSINRIKILREYLPKISAKPPCGLKAVIPEQVILSLKSARDRRNPLTHVGKVTIDPEDLREWMNAISDLLWLLDYYRAYDWAISHIRSQTRDQIVR